MTAIIILGMHRSGTSALAGALESMGAYIGEANPNVKEQGALVSINEQILKENSCTWDKPGDVYKFPEKQKARAREFLAELSHRSQYFIIKDPRLVLTIEQWIRAGLIENYKLIATFRNPVSVAKSLNTRNPIRWDITKGIDLWCEYNNRLLKLIRTHACPLIDFDQPIAAYEDALSGVLKRYEIELPRKQSYIDEERIHWPLDEDSLRMFPNAGQLYSDLKAASWKTGP